MPTPYALTNPTGRATLEAEYRALGLTLDPEPKRFRIKRLPLIIRDDTDGTRTVNDFVRPWCIHDRERPSWVGRAATHAEAIETVDELVLLERRAQGEYWCSDCNEFYPANSAHAMAARS
jgi:hypothetical protein